MAGRQDIEAGRAFVRLFLKNDLTKQLSGALDGMGKKLRGVGTQVAAVGAGVVGIGAGLLAPIIGSIKHFAAFGDQLDKMSARTGIAGPALAELGFAAEQSGASIETIEKAIKRMQRVIVDAGDGPGEAADALARLKVRFEDLEGLAPEEQFQIITDALGDIEDATIRSATAQELFARAGTELLPMLGNLQALRQEARDLGLVPSDQQIKDAAKITDALNRIRRVVKATAFEIGASLAGNVLLFADAAKNVVITIKDWIKENIGLVKIVAAVGVALVAAGTALLVLGGGIIAVGFLLSGLATIVAFIGSAIGLLFTPLGGVAALLVAGAVLWVKYTDSGKAAIDGIKELLGELLQIAKKAFGGISDALRSGDIELAGKIAFTALKLAALRGLDALSALVGDTIGVIAGQLASGDLSGAWATTLEGLASLWASWSQSVIDVTTGMADSIIDVWQKMVTSISGKILELASLPGFNVLFKFISDVDVLHEIERAKGFGIDDPLGKAKGIAAESIAGKADAARSALDEARDAAAAAATAAAERLKNTVGKGMSDLFFEALLTEAELNALTAKAKEARDKAVEATDKDKASAAADATGSRTSGFVTFSAEAAIALGFQARGPEARSEKHLAEIKALTREMLEKDKELLDEMKRLVLGLVFG